jgi:hypothetical protein
MNLRLPICNLRLAMLTTGKSASTAGGNTCTSDRKAHHGEKDFLHDHRGGEEAGSYTRRRSLGNQKETPERQVGKDDLDR